MTTFVLTYEHRHGVDVLLFESEEDAQKGAVHQVLEYIGELEAEHQKTVLEHVEAGRWTDAMTHYTEHHGRGESFYIGEGAKGPSLSGPSLKQWAAEALGELGEGQ